MQKENREKNIARIKAKQEKLHREALATAEKIEAFKSFDAIFVREPLTYELLEKIVPSERLWWRMYTTSILFPDAQSIA